MTRGIETSYVRGWHQPLRGVLPFKNGTRDVASRSLIGERQRMSNPKG